MSWFFQYCILLLLCIFFFVVVVFSLNDLIGEAQFLVTQKFLLCPTNKDRNKSFEHKHIKVKNPNFLETNQSRLFTSVAKDCTFSTLTALPCCLVNFFFYFKVPVSSSFSPFMCLYIIVWKLWKDKGCHITSNEGTKRVKDLLRENEYLLTQLH